MILYDGIIEKIQNNGGVSVVFKELVSRMTEYTYLSFDNPSNLSIDSIISTSRMGERYRDANIDFSNEKIFHSTYYRLPNIQLPVVTTVHDFTYEKFICGVPQWVHSWQKNRAIKASDKIICVSENTANDLLSYCPVDESKIVVVNNGVSTDYFPIENFSSNTNEVIFIGARTNYKNFYKAVDAISLTNDLTLSVVGGGHLTDIEVSYLNRRLPGRYLWLGYLSNQELNRVYNRAFCLLYPSSYEGFGIPIIEAMRAGCPVVALNCSSIPEVAGSAALLLDNSDINLIAEGLGTFSNVNQRQKYISDGLINSQRFSWDRCFHETLKVYESL